MNRLNLPPFEIRLEQRQGKLYVWDILRSQWVRLTPEEWVRQHFVHYLTGHLGYPEGLLQNEVSLKVGELSRRTDTVLYDRQLRPQMLVEYKAPSVTLSQRTLEQIVCYNYTMQVPYLILSNGLQHIAYHIDYTRQSYSTLREIPSYRELCETLGRGLA